MPLVWISTVMFRCFPHLVLSWGPYWLLHGTWCSAVPSLCWGTALGRRDGCAWEVPLAQLEHQKQSTATVASEAPTGSTSQLSRMCHNSDQERAISSHLLYLLALHPPGFKGSRENQTSVHYYHYYYYYCYYIFMFQVFQSFPQCYTAWLVISKAVPVSPGLSTATEVQCL